jgi:hypothetical protein
LSFNGIFKKFTLTLQKTCGSSQFVDLFDNYDSEETFVLICSDKMAEEAPTGLVADDYSGRTLQINDEKKQVVVSWWRGGNDLNVKEVLEIPANSHFFSPDAMVREDNLQEVLKENIVMKPYRVGALRVLVEFFEKINVQYFISDGTLLAAYRDNGVMIPKDVDCDVSILEEDLPKLWENRHLLPSCYEFDTQSGGTDWRITDRLYSKYRPGIDVSKKFTLIDNRSYSHIIYHTLPPEIDIYTFR